jgi:predicted DNA-binding transcriptional regulator AlpA
MEAKAMVRKAMRLPGVCAAFGIGKSTVYEWVEKGLLPKPTKIDPANHSSVWWEDEIEAVQKAAVERQQASAVYPPPPNPDPLIPPKESAKRRTLGRPPKAATDMTCPP